MRFHTQTAGVSLTAQQPLNNIVRTAIEALAGVLGGTQSLHTNSYDEALALPTEEAVRVALRTQQIIAHETGVTNTIDPLGGSLLRRGADRRIEEQAYEYFAQIDELGGMVEAVKRGLPAARDRRRGVELQRDRRAGASSSASTRHRGDDDADRARRPALSASRSTACRPSAPGATPPPPSRPATLEAAATTQPHAAAARRGAGPRHRGRDLQARRTSAATPSPVF